MTTAARWHYELARHCLTRGTVHSEVAAASAVLQRSSAPANWRGTCKQSTGMVPVRTSTLSTVTCVVKHFRGWSVCHVVCRHAERRHNVLADCAGSDFSYYRHHPAIPNRTQFALCPSMPALEVQLHVSRRLCEGPLRACSLFPTDCTAAALPFKVQWAESCFIKRRLAVFNR